MISTSKTGAVKIITMSLGVAWLVAGCAGGTPGAEEATSAAPSAAAPQAAPRTPSAAPGTPEGGICEVLLPQQEGFNYFPPLILSEREGAPELLEAMIAQLEDIDATAVPELQTDLETLAGTMALGRGEAKDFDYDAFVAAKVEVDKWVNASCI